MSDSVVGAETSQPVVSAAEQRSPQIIDSAPVIYFERQRLWRCGVHALNNLLGKDAFTADALDEIANTSYACRDGACARES